MHMIERQFESLSRLRWDLRAIELEGPATTAPLMTARPKLLFARVIGQPHSLASRKASKAAARLRNLHCLRRFAVKTSSSLPYIHYQFPCSTPSPCLAITRKTSFSRSIVRVKHHTNICNSDLVMCRKQAGIAIGRLCDKCDGKCPVCDSYVRPTTLVRICDECSFGNYQNKCVVCGGEGISDAFYCFECTRLEKDRDGCPKIINLGSSRTDVSLWVSKCIKSTQYADIYQLFYQKKTNRQANY